MRVQIFFRIDTVRNGLIIPDGKWKRSNSLVQGFMALLCAQLTGSSFTAIDINGTNRTVSSYANNFLALGPAHDNTYGIQLGGDNTAVAITDYALGSIFPDGAGSDELDYSASTIVDPYTVAGSDAYCSFKRIMTNNSGAQIDVEEIGLYARLYISYKVCIDRTLQSFSIPNTEGKQITYKFLISV